METRTHRRLAIATVLGLQVVEGLPHLTLVGTVLASASAGMFAGGVTSPDIDQRWKEGLGRLRPFAHRRITHWWGLPAAVAVLWLIVNPPLPTLAWSVVLGAWIGWLSHLVGDAAFGAPNPVYNLPRGIPLAPWWAHIGTGWHCGRWGEHVVSVVLWVATVVLLVVLTGSALSGTLRLV